MIQLSSHRFISKAFCLSTLALCLIVPKPAWSHGMRPMVRKIVNQNDTGITGIQLTRGLAQRLPDGRWQFTCPHFCNKTMYPLVTQASPDSMWVAGNKDFYELQAGIPTPTNQEDLNGGRLRGMATLNDRVIALQSVPPSSSQLVEISREGPATVLKEFETPYNFMTVINDVVYLGLGQIDTISMTTLDLETLDVLHQASWSAPQIADILGVALIRNRLFAAVRFIDRNSLLALDESASATELISSVYQATLPFDDNGTLLTIVDSRLHQINDSTVTPVDTGDERIYELFHTTAFGNYLSTSRGLFVFEGLGEPLTELFIMDELHPPILDNLEGRALEFCETHWADLKRDWLLSEEPIIRALPNEEDPTPQSPSDEQAQPQPTQPPTPSAPNTSEGCTQLTLSTPSSWPWLICMLFLMNRRRTN